MQYTDTLGRIITDSWAIFAAIWLVSALFSKRTAKRGLGKLWVVRIIAVVVILGIARIVGDKGGYLFTYIHNPTVRIVGIVIFFVGIITAVWARYHLGRNWGAPMSEKADAELVTSGPYAYIRHPIYTGFLVSVIGTMLTLGLLWVLVFVFAGGYFVYAMAREDEIMARLFPDTYPAYKARTKKIIPGIW